MDVVFERRGKGPPLVLLHGIGHRWQAWEPVFDLLAAERDVIALDLPGFGASPLLPHDTAYDMDTAMRFLAETVGTPASLRINDDDRHIGFAPTFVEASFAIP